MNIIKKTLLFTVHVCPATVRYHLNRRSDRSTARLPGADVLATSLSTAVVRTRGGTARLDVLDGMHSVKLCIGYQADGEAVDYFPSQPGLLERCSPIYEELAGWTDPTAGATSLQQLPPQAMAYVKRIEEIAGCTIDLVSTGPKRHESIIVRPIVPER